MVLHKTAAKPAETEAPAVTRGEAKTVSFDFAVNKAKLARAQKQVAIADPALQGEALYVAVKESYVGLGGLLTETLEDRGAAGKKGGKEVNLAANDEDKE